MTGRHLAAVADQPRRAVLYVRVSALMGRGGDDFHSPDVQVAAMRRATSGMREVEVVDTDIDVSGTTFSRAGLDRIRDLVEARRVDVIAVYDLSRLGRNVLESLQFLRWINERGVTIVSACEQIDTSTPAGEMMLINLLNIAQFRSREIGRAWQQIIARRQSRGQWHGTVPRGYRLGEDGHLAEDPLMAQPVRQLLGDYAAGKSNTKARQEFHAATGVVLSNSTLRKMATSDTYRGIVIAGDGTKVPGAHPALVDDVTWQRIQRRVAAAATAPPRYESPQYSVTGLGRCGRCGGHTVVRRNVGRTRSGGPTYVQVMCRRGHEAAPPCKGCGAASLASVEAALLDEVRTYAAKLRGDVDVAEARRARAARAGVDRTTLERELAEVRQAMVRLTTRWARQTGDDPVYDQAMAELRDTEARLQARAHELADIETGPTAEEVGQIADELLAMWRELDTEERNRALRVLIDHFVIQPATRWRQPVSERIEVDWR